MTNSSSQTFLKYCETVQSIAESRGSLKKTLLFANYLKTLNNTEDIDRCVRFTGEGAFSSVSGKRASIGARTVALCAAQFCDIDYEIVFKACRTATGSASETIEKLMSNIPVAKNRRRPSALSLAKVEQLYIQLEKERKRDAKQQLLIKAWEQMTPLEIKYFIRVMGQGSLRIGFEAKSIVNAVAKAFEREPEVVRYAHMITGSLGRAAVLAYENQLDKATFTLFQPVAFMLASPMESRAIEDIRHYIAEEKFDGMRSQLHADTGKVTLYSRDLNEITHSFPEVVDFFSEKNLPGVVLDGELCVFKDDTIQPFQLLQKRMGVKKPSRKMLEEFPVVFITYDVLFANEKPLFGKTLTERRYILKDICNQFGFLRSRQFEVTSKEQVEEMFQRAIAFGNEGLMLKHKNSTYEYGQRRKSWLKVKKPSGSIDTVIMYAHAGSGKRGGTYSDFTLGVCVKDDDRYEEEFIPIGKAYGGYTDEELKRLNQEMKKLIVDRFGPTYSLKPGLVVELEFDDIQVNKRTKAGFTLRFPRFKAIRWDLSPSDADTLMDVERMYNQKLYEERKPQSRHQSFIGN